MQNYSWIENITVDSLKTSLGKEDNGKNKLKKLSTATIESVME